MLECVTSFNLAEHFYGHVYDPPTGPWAYTRVANPRAQALPHQGRLYRPSALHGQAVGPVLRCGRLGETFAKDPRFADYRTRAANVRALYALVEEVIRTRTTAEWLADAQAAADSGGAG